MDNSRSGKGHWRSHNGRAASSKQNGKESSRTEKQELTKKCSLKLKKCSGDQFQTWYQGQRGVWPVPKGSLNTCQVVVIWDIEQCQPIQEYAPKLCWEMFRNVFSTWAGASNLFCFAAMSKDQTGYDEMMKLNQGQRGIMIHERPRRCQRTPDQDPLMCDMQKVKEELKANDVMVLISDNKQYVPYCARVRDKGINVIVMGPSLESTPVELLENCDFWMNWQTFARRHGRDFPKLKKPQQNTSSDDDESVEHGCQQGRSIDIVFLFDATSAMSTYITALRDSLEPAIKQLKERSDTEIRVGCVGYRDFMDKDKPETEPYVWPGGPDSPPNLEDFDLDDVKEFLSGVEARGGGDTAEDVLGGLIKVCEMLQPKQPCDKPSDSIVFHILDDPQHGREFNDYTDAKHDSYPVGPKFSLGNAVVPENRTKAWKTEAQEVLKDMKDRLKVAKYVILQTQSSVTEKTVAAFQKIVADQAGITAAKAGSSNGSWICSLECPLPDALHEEDMIREMSCSLADIVATKTMEVIASRKTLSKILTGGRQKKDKNLIRTEIDINGNGGSGRSSLDGKDRTPKFTDLPRGDRSVGTSRNSSRASSSCGSPTVMERQRTTDAGFKASRLAGENGTQSGMTIWEGPMQADDIKYEAPDDVTYIIDGLESGLRAQKDARNVVPLLFPRQPEKVEYYYDPESIEDLEYSVWQAYSGMRVGKRPGTENKQEPVVIEMFSGGANGHDKDATDVQQEHESAKKACVRRCTQHKVTRYLAGAFNKRCAGKGIQQVNGTDRKDFKYLDMWTSCMRCQGGLVHCTVQPLVIGVRAHYTHTFNPNPAQSLWEAFSHWSYEHTSRRLLVINQETVTDQETNEEYLSNSVVHCIPPVLGYFDDATNDGPQGVERFFARHTCNETCRQLGLRDACKELDNLKKAAKEGKLPGRQGEVMDL